LALSSNVFAAPDKDEKKHDPKAAAKQEDKKGHDHHKDKDDHKEPTKQAE
jgi:hypothetical protein